MPPLPGSDSVGEEARARLDDVIHSPVRLSVVAALAATDEAEFAAVRDAVQMQRSRRSARPSPLSSRPSTCTCARGTSASGPAPG